MPLFASLFSLLPVYFQHTLLAGLLIALISSILGVFIVQRGLSFLGDGLAHTSFGGLALSWFLGFESALIALAYSLISALAIVTLRRRSKLSADTSIGIFFAFSVALGALLISISQKNLQISLMETFFGSLFAIGASELKLLALLSFISLLFFIRYWSALAYSTFDEELAQSDGIPVAALDYAFYAFAAIIIVTSAKFVGVMLIAAHLVIPAATAKLISHSLFQMTLVAMVLALTATLAGLATSFKADWPVGSSIVLMETLFFLIIVLAKMILGLKKAT
ncbi:MAG: metal ABC transporter permease [Deinococcales bacterium]